MIIVMAVTAGEEEIHRVIRRIEDLGFKAHISKGIQLTTIGVIGDERKMLREQFSTLPGVDSVIPLLKPYRFVSRDVKSQDTIVKIAGVEIGGREIIVIAGPCSVENEEQIIETAMMVKAAGAKLMRGGAYKPRTSPYTFQGLGEKGLKLLLKARERTGLGIVTEVIDVSDVDLVADYADAVQIGARNMQNTQLLKKLSHLNKPVVIKRNFSATLTEFLMSAEYLLSGGNEKVVLCERGIRTFVEYTRSTLDLNIVPAIKQISHLPIIVDPSHGTGRHELVLPMSRAAIAAGADGLLVEVHPNPPDAYSDGEQSLSPDNFRKLIQQITPVASAVGRIIKGNKI